MRERIQKVLSSRGIASRRHAEDLIRSGRVTCNGTACQIGDLADADLDVICVDGVQIPSQRPHVYIMLHKPRGFITTVSDEKGRKNVMQLIADCTERVYPVGRLDMDSEGLLIFTNNGDLANRLMHPKHVVDKVYEVVVKNFSFQGLETLRRPIYLDGYKISPPQVVLVDKDENTATLRITIHEGRNRQVRRMCAAADMAVLRLKRIAEGNLVLGDLPCGQWRYLTDDEVTALMG